MDDAIFGAAEFKAKCLEILDRIDSRELTRVTITKRGKTVAMLVPPEAKLEQVEQLHGCLRGSVTIPAGFDVTAPVLDEPFSAEGGLLHE